MQADAYLPIKAAMILSGPASIITFALFVSSAQSNLIAFAALIISLMFITLSMWMLGWILDKDTGPRAMQEIAEPIKEGSEGFFMT